MWNVVTGLLMLAGAVVREQGQGVDDWAWRREAQGASETPSEETKVTVVAGPPIGTADADPGSDPIDRELATIEAEASTSAAPGDWEVACLRRQGSTLVIDRQSVREIGNGAVFRWAAPTGQLPETSEPIYTAVADCRAKSIEASWPGPRRTTRVGTCGRHLVEAACAAVAQ